LASEVFGTDSYTVLHKDANGAVLWSDDDVRGHDSQGIAYNQGGTNAVDRTVESRLRDIISVFDYMTAAQITDVRARTTAENVTTVIQNAIDDASNDEEIYLPSGSYLLNSGLTLNRDNIKFCGAGAGSTILVPNFATGDVLACGDGTTTREHINVSGFTIDPPSAITRSADAFIKINQVEQSYFNHLQLNQPFIGVEITDGATTKIELTEIDIRNTVAGSGIGILIDGGGDHYLTRCFINAPNGSQPISGIEIRNSNATWITDCDVIHSGIGLLVNPNATGIVTWLFVLNSAFDLCENDGIRIKSTNSAAINKGHNFVGCWSSSNGAVGVRIDGDDVPDGIQFTSHRSVVNGTNGYIITKGKNIFFDACICAGNSDASDGVSAGFEIAANTDKFAIRNCKIGRWGRLTNDHGVPININAGTSNDYIITGNDMTENDAVMTDGGTGTSKVVRDNIGYVTENQGTGEIANATTSDVITHGLNITPALGTIHITGGENPTADVGTIWVDTIGATTFTVNCEVDPGASGFDFGWSVR